MYAAYEALGVRGMRSGSHYNDPLTDVLITKVTDANTPVSNTTGTHAYSNGPTQISQPWGANGDRYTLHVYLGNEGSPWLVDYQLGGTLSNWRRVPGPNPLGFTFSNDPATPQIAYYLDGATLHRYDASSNRTVDTGYFPVSGQGVAWLQIDAHDGWIVSADGSNVYAFNTTTGARLSRAAGSGFDEPYMEHGGRYVFLVRNVSPNYTNTIWDLSTNSTTEYQGRVNTFHAASLFGYWTGEDVISGGSSAIHGVRASDGRQIDFWGMGGYDPNYHDAGQWLQPNVPQTEQYYLKSTEDADHWGNSDVPGMLSLIRLDGRDARVVAHLYTNRNGSDNYWQSQSRATISPDGLLVMFTSDMNNAGGRGDLFVAEVPRQ